MNEKEAASGAEKRVLRALLSLSELKRIARKLYAFEKVAATHIEPINLHDLLPELKSLRIEMSYWPILGGMEVSEVSAISYIVKKRNPKKIFEIGTFKGLTTYHMALNSSPQCEIMTLDLPPDKIGQAKLELTDLSLIKKERSGERFHGTEVERKIRQLFGDSANFDYSPYYGEIDLVLVDGAHSYDYVLSDSEVARKLVSPNGVILWHDYPTWNGVWLGLEKIEQRWGAKFRRIEGTTLVLYGKI